MGLAVGDGPLACWSHRRDRYGSCILHGQTNRYSFFRGGGLGGRPRTPKDSPLWGRPSGVRSGRRGANGAPRGDSNVFYNQNRQLEEIIDSDDDEDDDDQGVGLQEEFHSDELRFTGADIGRMARRRRKYEYSDVSESSDDVEDEEEEGSDDGTGGGMQLVLRDKEEALVQKALNRIRRAQELGKTNVKLPVSELQALRKRQKDEENDAPRVSSKTKDRRRSSGQAKNVLQDSRSISVNQRKHATRPVAYDNDSSSGGRHATPPGALVPGPDGVPVYRPFGVYPPPLTDSIPKQSKGSKPKSRATSSHGPSPQPSSPSLVRPPGKDKKRFSNSREKPSPPRSPKASPRRLPDDPNWMPRPRSSSSISGAVYQPEQYQYQAYSPPLPEIPQQYAKQVQGSRRTVSTPQQLSRHYDMQPAHQGRPETRDVEPSRLRRAVSAQEAQVEVLVESSSEDETSESEEESSGGQEHGVQVDAASYMRGFSIPDDKGREKQRRGKR